MSARKTCLSSGAPNGRWRLTLIFGMVHGLGFATELKEKLAGAIGAKIAFPLLSFNLGVELGQIAVAALVLPLILWMRIRAGPSSALGAGLLRVGRACRRMVAGAADAACLRPRVPRPAPSHRISRADSLHQKGRGFLRAVSDRDEINERASTINEMAMIQEPRTRTPTLGQCFRMASDA